MWWPVAAEFIEPWTRAMARASLTGGLAIASSWLICRSLPRMSPTVRSWIWRLVYLKLTLLMLWPIPIPMPLLPPNPSVRIERDQALEQAGPRGQEFPTASLNPTSQSEPILPPEPTRPAARFSSVALLVIWLGGVLFVATRTIRNAVATNKTIRDSQPLTDPRLREECEMLSHHLRELRSGKLPRTASAGRFLW
jgi:hypothetical protein